MLYKVALKNASYAVMDARDRACDFWIACGEDYRTDPDYLAAKEACAKAWEKAAEAVGKDHQDYGAFVNAAIDWRNSVDFPGPADFKKPWVRLLSAIYVV